MQFNQDPQQPSLGHGGNYGGDSGNYGGGNFSQPQGLSQFQSYNPPSSSGFDGASLVRSNGNPLGGVYSQPGMFGNASLTGGVPGVGGGGSQGPQERFNPGYDNVPAGYNQNQYASLDSTNRLAELLGGNAIRTLLAGAFTGGAPPQNSIDFGGDSPLNAGLLGDRYSKYDRATADAMTRAELAVQGPKNTSPDAAFNTQFQALPGGQNHLGGGSNLGQYVSPVAPPTPAAASVASNISNGTPTANPNPPTYVPPPGVSPQTPATHNPVDASPGQPAPGSGTPNPGTPAPSINPAQPPQGLGGGNSSDLAQLLQMILGGGNRRQGLSAYTGAVYPQPQQQYQPQFIGTGGRGQFNNFMTGNGYQQQGNIWARPGQQSPYSQPGSMRGFAQTMNAFQNPMSNRSTPYGQSYNYGGY